VIKAATTKLRKRKTVYIEYPTLLQLGNKFVFMFFPVLYTISGLKDRIITNN